MSYWDLESSDDGSFSDDDDDEDCDDFTNRYNIDAETRADMEPNDVKLSAVKTKDTITVSGLDLRQQNFGFPTLLETCARSIGQNLPFERVQHHPQRFPVEAQKTYAPDPKTSIGYEEQISHWDLESNDDGSSFDDEGCDDFINSYTIDPGIHMELDDVMLSGAETKNTITASGLDLKQQNFGFPTLLETCAHFIGQNLPYKLVQHHPQHIPVLAQKRIAYWSFPLVEERFLHYAELMGVNDDTIASVKLMFARPKYSNGFVRPNPRDKCCEDIISSATQIGMYLVGFVEDVFDYQHCHKDDRNKQHSVCVQFDRGRIISAMCSCQSCCISKWCEHVVVLCMARIRGVIPYEVHPPLGEIQSEFCRDELQKLFHRLFEKTEFPSLMASIREMKAAFSETSTQHKSSDQTAGEYLEDSPQWQINESILRSRLDMELGDFEPPFKEIRSVCDIQDFAALLRGHDDNVALAVEWIVTKLKSYYPSYSGCATAERNLRSQICWVAMESLQIFLVDPFIFRYCKEKVLKFVQKDEMHFISTTVTDYLANLVQESLLIFSEHPKPAIEYLKKVENSLKAENDESGANHLALLASLTAVLQYYLFHKHPPSTATTDVLLNIYNSIFPASLSDVSSFEELIHCHSCLDGIHIYNLLRCGLILVEYLISSGGEAQTWTEFVVKLLGASSVTMPLNVCSISEEIFLTIIRIEENLLSKVQKERLLLSPHLHEMLKEYLESMCTVPKDGVFTWPWSLLRMAVFAHNMMEDVSKIVQNLLNNPQSILYCRSQKGSGYPPMVIDATRNSLQSLLGYLLQNLPRDSAQLLFTTLSTVFPYPPNFSDSPPTSHIKVAEHIATNVLYQLHGENFDPEQSVLPNCTCNPLWLPCIKECMEFKEADESIRNNLLVAVTTRLSVLDKHVDLLFKLTRQLAPMDDSLLLQLHLLLARTRTCSAGCSNGQIVLSCAARLDRTSQGARDALLYLIDNWHYCLSPSNVIDIVASLYLVPPHTVAGCEEELAQLILAAVNTSKMNLMRKCFGVMPGVIAVLVNCATPEHLLTFAEKTCDANSDAEELVLIGRGIGQMYNRLKVYQEIEESFSHVKSTCMWVLEFLAGCVSVPRYQSRHIDVISNSSSGHCLQYYLHRIKATEWAPIVCATGGTAVKNFLAILYYRYKVKLLKKFPYQFCQDLGILWNEFRRLQPLDSPSIFSVPVFRDTITLLTAEKEENLKALATVHKASTEEVKEAMFLLASIYQPLQLDKEFQNIAAEIAHSCNEGVKEMVDRCFVQTTLLEINIPGHMYRRFPELDAQGSARHKDEGEHSTQGSNPQCSDCAEEQPGIVTVQEHLYIQSTLLPRKRMVGFH